jgi:diguanylate cyclase (GGDEF)-like protein/PAS domain S-box-containing protein
MQQTECRRAVFMTALVPIQFRRCLLPFLVVVAAYLAAAELGHALSFPGHFASFWPPSGLYLAALLLARRRWWPMIAAAALVGNLLSDVLLHEKTILISVGFWISNTAEAISGAGLLTWLLGERFRIGRLSSVLVFSGVAGLLCTAIGAVLGAVVVWIAFDTSFGVAWLRWWSSGMVGVIVVAPPIYALATDEAPLGVDRAVRMLEAFVLLTLLTIVAQLTFGLQSWPLAWAVIPLFLWAALRFEVPGTTVAIAALAVIAVWHTAQGRGPFATLPTVLGQVLLVQSYVWVLAVSFLVVSAVVRERGEWARAARDHAERYRELFDHTEEHVFSTDAAGRFLHYNRACREALGYTDEEMRSLTLDQLIPYEHLDHFHSVMHRQRQGEIVRVCDAVVRTKAGRLLDVEGVTRMHFTDGRPDYSVSFFRDVTERKARERQFEDYWLHLESTNKNLHQLAATDPLTGLSNRRLFHQRLQEELERSRRYGAGLSLVLLDVDHFKSFNDTFGHPAGDDVLREVAQLLGRTARPCDIVARIGGEEFAVLLPDTAVNGALLSAERFRREIEQASWDLRGITVSVGVATLSTEVAGPDAFIERADAALYRSKGAGRNCVHHFGQVESATAEA